MEIKQVSTTEIIPYEKNAKLHPDEQVEWIANSIREFGFKQPLVLDKDNVIVIGHGRLLAAKKLGMENVPCVYANDLNEEQIKALRLADNKTNESGWDFDLLTSELDEIALIDMSDFGFGTILNELDDFIADGEIDGGDIPEKERAKVAVKLVFSNSREWRKHEDSLREFVDKMDGVSVSVGEYNEDQ